MTQVRANTVDAFPSLADFCSKPQAPIQKRVSETKLVGEPPKKRGRVTVVRTVVDDFKPVDPYARAEEEDEWVHLASNSSWCRFARKDRSRGGGSMASSMDRFQPPLPPHDAPFEMNVQNLVFTAKLNTLVNLRHVAAALAFCGAELNQKRFSAVILRTSFSAVENDPYCHDTLLQQLTPLPKNLIKPRLDKVAVLIFRNGNCVCTGSKTVSQARYMLIKTARLLQNIGYVSAHVDNLHVQNVVGRAQLPCRINRERMAREIPAYATYDPSHFPGVSFKHPSLGPITLLIFDSGRVVITGTRNRNIANMALAKIKPLLVHFDATNQSDKAPPIISTAKEGVDNRSLYAVINCRPGDSNKHITRSYKSLMLKIHPDKLPLDSTPEQIEKAKELLLQVQTAYAVISDDVRRTRYDRTGEFEGSHLFK